MTEIRIIPCAYCNGDGGFDEPAAWTPTWFRCERCDGQGYVEVECEPMTPEDLEFSVFNAAVCTC